MDIGEVICKQYPLEHEYETDARDIWPKRFSVLLDFLGDLTTERNKYRDALQKISDGTGTIYLEPHDRYAVYFLSKKELQKIAQEAL